MYESMIAYNLEKAAYWEDDTQWNLPFHHTPAGKAWRLENADYYRDRARSAARLAGYQDPEAMTARPTTPSTRKGVSL